MRKSITGGGSSFTEKQGQYLAFIYAYSVLMQRAPAEADFQRYFDVTPPAVHRMILALADAGLIRRTPGAARSIDLLVEPAALPLLRPSPQSITTTVREY